MEKSELYKKSLSIIRKNRENVSDILNLSEKKIAKVLSSFSAIFNSVSDIVLLLDKEKRIIATNNAFKELWGYSPETVLNKTTDFLYETDIDIQEKNPTEFKFINMHGEDIYCESVRTPVMDENNNTIAYLDTHRNISERKIRELETQSLYQRLHDLIFCSGDWVWEINKHGFYTYVDGKVRDILGYEPSQIIGKAIYFFMPESEKKNFTSEFNNIALNKKPIIDMEIWNLTSDGKLKRILTNGIPIVDDKGELTGYRGVHKDITEKSRLANEVKTLASFPMQNPFPILRIRHDGTIIFCNPPGESILEYWNIGIGEKVDENIFTLISDVIKVNFPCNFELSFKGIYYTYTIVPANNTDYVNLYFYEITDRKKTEEALAKSEERYRLAQKAANIGNWEWNILDNTMSWSDIGEEIYGFEENTARTYNDFLIRVHPNDRKSVEDAIQNCLTNNSEYGIEHRIVLPDGDINWVFESGLVTRNFSGKPIRMFGIVRDITKYKEYEEELLILSRGVEQSPASILFTDTLGNIQYVNQRFMVLSGYHESEVIGMNPRIFKSGNHAPVFYQNLWNTITQGHEWHGEICNLKKNGQEIWLLASISPIIDNQGNLLHYLFVGEDITEKHKLEESIKHQALHDTLTGLPNRVFLRDRLDQALVRCARTNKKSAIIYIDLDKFKPINDKYGHAEGDNILILVADRIKSCLRRVDTATRLGGDEFVVVLEDLDEISYAMTLAHRILNCITLPIHIKNEDYCLGASIGVAIYPDHGTEVETLIANADQAMYAVKNSGRNNIRFYESITTE